MDRYYRAFKLKKSQKKTKSFQKNSFNYQNEFMSPKKLN